MSDEPTVEYLTAQLMDARQQIDTYQDWSNSITEPWDEGMASDGPIRRQLAERAPRPNIEIGGCEIGGCDDSPNCASVINIEPIRPGGSWLEIHLTPEETQWVIDCLTESLEKTK